MKGVLKKVHPKFQKSSVSLQLAILLENKLLHKYFLRILLKEKRWLNAWELSRFSSIEAPIPLATKIGSTKTAVRNFLKKLQNYSV